MLPSLPICCDPLAFKLLKKQIPKLESLEGLLNAATAIAMCAMPNVDPVKINETLQSYADAIRRRVRGPQPQALLAHLHQYLFDELKFIGNTENFYKTDNNYLPAVLKDRTGTPISLCLIYKIVGERIGLRIQGIGLPGHFLCRVETEIGPMLVDPFSGGRVVTVEEAQGIVRERFGEDEWSDEFLEPISHLHWLTRMMQNLLHIFSGAGQYTAVVAMLEMEVALWPKQLHLQRDIGLVLARVGLSRQATEWLDLYLTSVPDDPQRPDLEVVLEKLKA